VSGAIAAIVHDVPLARASAVIGSAARVPADLGRAAVSVVRVRRGRAVNVAAEMIVVAVPAARVAKVQVNAAALVVTFAKPQSRHLCLKWTFNFVPKKTASNHSPARSR
jgi:hypothetical protein